MMATDDSVFSTLLHSLIFQTVKCLALSRLLPWCVRIQAAAHLNHQLSVLHRCKSPDDTLFFDKKAVLLSVIPLQMVSPAVTVTVSL